MISDQLWLQLWLILKIIKNNFDLTFKWWIWIIIKYTNFYLSIKEDKVKHWVPISLYLLYRQEEQSHSLDNNILFEWFRTLCSLPCRIPTISHNKNMCKALFLLYIGEPCLDQVHRETCSKAGYNNEVAVLQWPSHFCSQWGTDLSMDSKMAFC